MGLDEPELGVCHLCSLISPVQEFAAQQDAVATAEAVMENLMQAPADAERDENHPASRRKRRGCKVSRLPGRTFHGATFCAARFWVADDFFRSH